MRALICRWLGIPTREEIRAAILLEIDAEKAWLLHDDLPSRDRPNLVGLRLDSEACREFAIQCGRREDTRG